MGAVSRPRTPRSAPQKDRISGASERRWSVFQIVFRRISGFFKFLRHILEQPADGQVLGTDLFAFAAFETVGRFAAGRGMDDAVVIVRVPVVVELLGVHDGEQGGDGDVLRTAVGAVAAGGAGG